MKLRYTIFALFISCMFTLNCYGQNIDRKDILRILSEAYKRDQEPRKILDSLFLQNVTDANKYIPVIDQQRHADSVNAEIVFPIIDMIYDNKTYDLDSSAYQQCWTIIQHSTENILVKYKDFVNQLLRRKLISRNSYMAYIDRCEVKNCKAQVYGYQFKRFPNGLLIPFPIKQGYKGRWNDLGIDYDEKLLIPSNYDADFNDKVCLDNSEFAILGVVTNQASQDIKDCYIYINDNKAERTTSRGFFKLICDKRYPSQNIKFKYKKLTKEYKLNNYDNKDFIILNCIISDDNIEVIEE